jgi:hypothetical protein
LPVESVAIPVGWFNCPCPASDVPIWLQNYRCYQTLGCGHYLHQQSRYFLKYQLLILLAGLYDINNQVVGTQFTYANPSDIGSGEKAPFVLILTSASILFLK